MRVVFLVCHRDRPWSVLLQADDLDVVAQSLSVQPNAAELHVYASDGGQSRELTETERRALEQRLSAPPS